MQNYFETTPPPYFAADFDYFRIPRERWELLLTRLKQLGSTALLVNVPWGFHELEAGVVDLHGISNPRRDLSGLLKLSQSLGLPCLLNLGPYLDRGILGQGIPVWLPNQRADAPFSAAVRRWAKTLSQTLVAEQWPAGPLVALQVKLR
jgi:beta-galactosidase GanA